MRRKMNILTFPVLLLVMQLMVTVLGGTNQTQTANPASINVTNVTNTTAAPAASAASNINGTATTNTTTTGGDAGKTTVIKMVQTQSTKLTAVGKQSPQPELKDKQQSVKMNNDTIKESTTVLARGVTNTDAVTVPQQKIGNTMSAIKSTAATKTTTTATAANQTGKILADGVTLSDINNNKNSSINSNSNANAINKSSNSSTTTTTTSTTTPTTTTTKATTTTTTTQRPKKPKVTISMDQQVEGEKLDASAGAGSVAPHVLPVQEMSSLPNRGENEYIVPIISVMLAVPLAIAVFIIVYRRFRDLWSTRHYRRMDFLVDGMYND